MRLYPPPNTPRPLLPLSAVVPLGGMKCAVVFTSTIPSTGNSTDFGDATVARGSPGSASNSIRGVWGGGTPGTQNIIDYVTIASTGNAVDFGDRTVAKESLSGCSDSHGGLG